MAIFPVVMARLGNVELSGIGLKILLAMPFALMVGLFNPLFDTVPRLEVTGISVSGGWLSLVSILIRAALTVAAALILIAVLGIYRLCAGLDRLGVPRVLTTQLLVMYRYTAVLSGELGRMSLARELRSTSSRAMSLAVYGALLGHLLLRTLERAQRIHQAMLARGGGPLPIRHAGAWQFRDTVFLLLVAGAFLLIRSTDLAGGLGRLLVGLAA